MSSKSLTLPVGLGWVAVVGGMLALFATYWDEAWHTDIGRDSALSAPHVLLYGSVGVVGLVVAAWGVRTLLATRSLRATLAYQPVLLAALGGAGALAAAPIDAVWHARFGRDAVLWSPPHMLVVFASTALVIGLLAGLPRDAGILRSAVGVVLLGNAVAVVFEYETDVPQFSEVFYLPLLLVTGLLVAAVARAAVPVRAPVATIVVGYVVLRLVIAVVLGVLGRSIPDLPLAVLGLALIDLPMRHRWQRYALGAAATAVIAWLACAAGWASPAPDAVAVTAVPVAIIGALVVLSGPLASRRIRPATGVALIVAILALAFPPAPASAHDPGQGDPVSRVELTGTSDGAGTLTMTATMTGCDRITPTRVVARRAGDTRTQPLRASGGCVFTGRIEVPADGRWFTYVELRRDGQLVEAWLPLDSSRVERITQTRELYVPAQAKAETRRAQLVAGALIYTVGLVLLAAAARVVLQTRARTQPPDVHAA